jgi:hypothetical protein
MVLARIDANALAIWTELVKAQSGDIEFHVTGQGYELRCGDAEPLRIEEDWRKEHR